MTKLVRAIRIVTNDPWLMAGGFRFGAGVGRIARRWAILLGTEIWCEENDGEVVHQLRLPRPAGGIRWPTCW